MFVDRQDAGRQLARLLKKYRGREGLLVLALPRGGVVVGFEIAAQLKADLDVLIVRKIGFPWQPELAAGAVAETGTVVMNREMLSSSSGAMDAYIEQETARQKEEIVRRVALYRKGAAIKALKDRTVIVVDDGVATGATMKAAIEALKQEGIRELVVAVPVAPPVTAEELRDMADEFICIKTPPDFLSVGNHYLDFTQVSDEEVVGLLEKAGAVEGGKAA
jgi:predicted phosphoribosyltransferase